MNRPGKFVFLFFFFPVHHFNQRLCDSKPPFLKLLLFFSWRRFWIHLCSTVKRLTNIHLCYDKILHNLANLIAETESVAEWINFDQHQRLFLISVDGISMEHYNVKQNNLSFFGQKRILIPACFHLSLRFRRVNQTGLLHIPSKSPHFDWFICLLYSPLLVRCLSSISFIALLVVLSCNKLDFGWLSSHSAFDIFFRLRVCGI